jgi:peptide deformylase
MAQLPILTYPHPILKAVATPVQVFDAALQRLVTDMLETMYAAKGVGLAAPQVAVSQRLLVIDCQERLGSTAVGMPLVMVNPEILEHHDSIFYEEGCLSFPGIYAKVKRHRCITVRYQDQHGEEHTLACDANEGLLAICVQHEIDHLNGITFYDHLSAVKKKMLQQQLDRMMERHR